MNEPPVQAYAVTRRYPGLPEDPHSFPFPLADPETASIFCIPAPLRLLQLRHQTAHLLGESAGAVPSATEFRQVLPPSAGRAGDRRAPARHQIELPLSA